MSDGPPPGFPPLISQPDEDEGPRILAATLTTCIAAFLAVSARCYVRGILIRSFGWDDAFMLFALLISVASQIIVILEVQHGAGRHIGDVPAESFRIAMMLNYITQITYLVALCVAKISLGASLLRIASAKFYRWWILGLIYFTTIYTAICVITILIQCTDIRMQWDETIPRQCWPAETLRALGYSNSIVTIITDLCFALFIPIPMFWNLNVTRRTRMTLYAILGLGAFACAAAIVKITYLEGYGKLGDWMYDSADITIWWVVECNVAIVAGSLPALRPLFRSLLGTVYGSHSKITPMKGSLGGTANAESAPSAARSGRNWQQLGSSRSGAEANSDMDIHLTREADAYELNNNGYGLSTQTRAHVVVDTDKRSEDGEVGGIMKTMETEVSYSRPFRN